MLLCGLGAMKYNPARKYRLPALWLLPKKGGSWRGLLSRPVLGF